MIYGNSEVKDILGKIKDDNPLLTPRQKDALGKLWDSLPARQQPREWENL